MIIAMLFRNSFILIIFYSVLITATQVLVFVQVSKSRTFSTEIQKPLIPKEVASKMKSRIMNSTNVSKTVRVIVRLKLKNFQSEGHLQSLQAVQQQRQAIYDLQTRVLERLMPSSVKSVKRFKFTPSMALEVDQIALEELRSSPDVEHIQVDTPIPPASHSR